MARVSLGGKARVSVRMHWSAVLAGAVLVVIAVVALPRTAPGYPGVVASRQRVRVQRVTVWLGGGITEFAERPRTPRAEFLISAAGPAATVATGGLFLTAAAAGPVLGLPLIALACLVWLAVVNGVVAVGNLLPGASLDGGQMLYALLWHRHGDPERAAALVVRLCRVLGGVLLAAGIAVLVARSVLSGLCVALVGAFLATDSDGDRLRGAGDRDTGGRMSGGQA